MPIFCGIIFVITQGQHCLLYLRMTLAFATLQLLLWLMRITFSFVLSWRWAFLKQKICTNTKKPRPHMPRKYAHVVYCNLGIKLTQRHIMFLWRHSSPRRVEEENRNEVSSVFNIFSPLSTLEGKRPLRPPLVRANAARRGRQGLPAPAGAQVGRFAAMSTKMASVAWLTLVLLWRLLVVLELDL